MTHRTLLLFALTGTLVQGPVPLHAQATTVSASCDEGWSTLGALGITNFSCDCTFDRNSTPAWRFRGEPRIMEVSSNGPAAGRLRAGDVLVAVDGMLITTRAAGARLGNLRPGVPVTLTVRRGNREVEVRIVPDEECELPVPPRAPVAGTPTPRPPGSAAAPMVPTPAPPGAMTPPVPPAPPVSGAWFGFGISCHNCEMNVTNASDLRRAERELAELLAREDTSPDVLAARTRLRDLRRRNISWRFSEYPTLFSVDPGSPADDAGLRRGDVLMKINGASLLTPDGAQRFALVEPGESVTFTYRRGGSERTVQVRAIERPSGYLRSATAEGLTETLATIEREQAQRAQELDSHAARLHQELARAEVESRGGSREQELAQLRLELERLSAAHSTETRLQLEKLRGELALVQQARGGQLSTTQEQHLRFAGSVGNTAVEVRGLSSVVVSYDNSTGELLIRTVDSTIRVKAPVER
jgi:membrane-associated protease RseP (regulator of RpoE activity)